MKKENDLDQRWSDGESEDLRLLTTDWRLETRDWRLETSDQRLQGLSRVSSLMSHVSRPNSDWKRWIALMTVVIFTVFTVAPSWAVAETINLEGGAVDVNVQDNVTNWNVTGNPIWNVPEFNVNQGSIYNIAGMGSGSSLALLVNGGSASNIFGTMNLSNLDFILQNIAGINFGASSMVNLSNASLIASTIPLNLSATDFLARDYQFSGKGGFLSNEGRITGTNADLVALVANAIENRGTIEVPMGTVALAAGNTVTVGISGDGLVSIGVDEATANSMGLSDQIKNTGTITAQGGRIVLDAKAIDSLFDKAINIAAGSNATSVVKSDDGVIEFVAQGDVLNNGTLQAERGSIDIRATGDVESYGTLKAATIEERGASFRLGGLISAGHVSMDNLDNLANITPGLAIDVDVFSDDDDILVEGDFSILRNVTIQTDADGLGTDGTLTWSSDYTMTGNSHNLTLKVSQDSTIGKMTDVNILTLDKNTGKTPTYTSAPATATWTDITDFRIADGVKLNRFTGEGTVGTPYAIYDVYGLQAMNGFLSSSFELANDIAASSTANWNAGLGFDPVGDQTNPFEGHLNGNNQRVTGLMIWRGAEYVGLFGATSGAEISNIGLVGGSVSGGMWIGGLVGRNLNSSITNSYNTGNVIGTGNDNEYAVGGLVGVNFNSPISNSYATGNVSGVYWDVGGLVGDNSGSDITNSYATGNVSGDYDVGGLVGFSEAGSNITNSYATGTVSGNDAVGGLVGEVSAPGTIVNSYATGTVTGNSGGTGGFVGVNNSSTTLTNNWWYNNQANGVGDDPDHPEVTGQWQMADGVSDFYGEGSGAGGRVYYQNDLRTIPAWDFATVWTAAFQQDGPTPVDNPYLSWEAARTYIVSEAELQAVSTGDLDGNYYLGADITLVDDFTNYIIGREAQFTGSFNGNGYTISDLLIDTPDSIVGLFGTTIGATLTDIGLLNVSITAGYSGDVGSLVGLAASNTMITNSYATGTVTGGSGGWSTGGLVGTNSQSTITGSYSAVNVTGDEATAGLVGHNMDSSVVSNSYATGTVTGLGSNYITGGLVGLNDGSSVITHSYATGNVTGGGSSVGGLVGQNGNGASSTGAITNSYATGNVTSGEGGLSLGGLVGWNNDSSVITTSYATGTVTGASGSYQLGGLVGYNLNASIASSYATGNVFGIYDNDQVGGLVGQSDTSTITNSYSTGSATGRQEVGGLVGSSSSNITNSFSTGVATATGATPGGFIGYYGSGTLTNNGWYNKTNTAATESGDIAGVTKASAVSDFYGAGSGVGAAIYANWDFDTVWTAALDSSDQALYFPSLAFDPRVFTEITDLAGMQAVHSGDLDGNYYLGADISLGDFTDYMIGSFTGLFIGHGHVLSDLTIDTLGTAGLFSSTNGATLTDMRLLDVDVTGGEGGGLVGSNNSSTITDSYTTGIVTGVEKTGGLVGTNTGSVISDSYSTAAITSNRKTGGLVGSNSSSTIINSYSTGTITAWDEMIGGLVGENLSSPIINSYSTSAVTAFGGAWSVGGLVGYSYSSVIANSYSAGSVTGDEGSYRLGGLVGFNESSSISNSYFTGAVQAGSGSINVGGLVGDNSASSITNSYSAGSVKGGGGADGGAVGGLVGHNWANSPITNSYSTATVTGSGTSEVGGLVGYNEASDITSSYAAASVSGESACVGGLIGCSDSGTLSNNWWYNNQEYGVGTNEDKEVADQWQKAGAVGDFYGVGSGTGAAVYTGWDFDTVWTAAVDNDDQPLYFPSLAFDPRVFNEITTEAGLQAISSGDLAGNYYLGENITLEDDFTDYIIGYTTGDWGEPLTNPFTGIFLGHGHTISNLYINTPGNYVGLFGITSGATLTDISLLNVNVTGNVLVGALVGYNKSSPISNSYATGTLSGRDPAGGLVGYNYSSNITNSYSTVAVTDGGSWGEGLGGLIGINEFSAITNSYATGTVTAVSRDSFNVGGLIGENYESTITNSYATGNVTGVASAVGGLVGANSASNISNSYSTGAVAGGGASTEYRIGGFIGNDGSGTYTNNFWDTETSGQEFGTADGDVAGITGNTTVQMKQEATFTGWDFTVDGQGAGSGTWIMAGLPHLQREWSETITNLAQLQMMILDLDADYTLAGDINALETVNWNAGAGFDPVGTYGGDYIGEYAFKGNFNGQGHTINGLTINRGDEDYVGLFGYIYNESSPPVIQNVGLTDANITGGTYVGALIGSNGDNGESMGGTVSNSYAAGVVNGISSVGGLVGYNSYGSYGVIMTSYADVRVMGSGSQVGGLVGNNEGSISDSYATGNVFGGPDGSTGGLVGSYAGLIITNSYATGTVDGGGFDGGIGGLVGFTFTGAITNSYATGAVKNGTRLGGLVGYQSGDVVNSGWFRGAAGTEAVNAIGDTGSGDPGSVDWETNTESDFYNKNYGVYDPNSLGDSPWNFDTVWTAAVDNSDQPLYFPSLAFDPRVFNEITTEAGLQAISSGDLAGNYYLGENITLEDDFTGYMIGDEVTPFSGIFLGHGHTISDLFIEAASSNVGFFGYTSGATLTDIGLLNVDVTGDWYVGGLVGWNSDSSISNSYTTGTVTGDGGGSGVGGLAGANISSTITNSYSTAVVLGDGNDLIGGLVGDNWNSGTIANSYATGAVTGGLYVGGLTGSNGSSTIINSYATGTVTGDVSGGLVGYDDGSNTYTNNFWNTETSGQEFGTGGGDVAGITGKTTLQMKQEATFTGWDFTSTWRMYEGFAYPLLKTFLTPITVTANNFTKIYDGSFTVLGSGVTYSIPSAVLEGTPGYSSPYKNVGTYVDGITVSGLWSTQQGYDITYAAGDLTISQKALAVTGVTVANKAYDGNANATLNTTSAALDGVVVGEEELVLLDTTLAVGTFGGLSIGTWPVTVSGMTIEGAGIGNYLLNQPAGLSATIGEPVPPQAINSTLNALQTIPAPPEQTKPAPVIQIGTETDNLTGNGATTVPASLVEEFRASLIEPAADLSAAEQPATLPATEPVTEVGTEPAAVTPAEPTKDTPNVSKGEVDDRAGGRQVLSLFRNSFPDFFDPRLAMNLQTDVRVLGGAVYVLDGMNDLAYLTSGESVRKLYAKKTTKAGVAKPEVVPAPGQPVRKIASPVVIRQTKEGMRYGTLRKPGKDVFMRSQGGEWMPAKDGMVILPGDEVKTAYKNSVEVLMDGGKVGRVEISGGSLFRISKAESDKTTGDKTTLLDLALGKILVKVEALKGNSKFEVRTPTALTGVRGTIFEVNVKEKA